MRKKSLLAVLLIIAALLLLYITPQVKAQNTNIDVSELVAEQDEIQNHAHEMAEHARALKMPDVVVQAQTAWANAQKTKTALVALSKYTESDVWYIAKTMKVEANGSNKTKAAAVAWCVLNRVDSEGYKNTISGVVTQPNQFAYHSGTNGSEMYDLALDVMMRWQMEKAGVSNPGRVLGKEYIQFRGDGRDNHYYMSYEDAQRGVNEWMWTYQSPYEGE